MAYSAKVSANLKIGEMVLVVAKTNGQHLSLSEPCPVYIDRKTPAILTITVDGEADARDVLIIAPVQKGKQIVRYKDAL